MFQRAAEGKRGEEALAGDRRGLRRAARSPTGRTCGPRCRPTRPATTPRSARSSAHGYGDLVAYVERVSGASAGRSRAFFAERMLMNVFASMGRSARPSPGRARLARGLQASRLKLVPFFRTEVSDDSQTHSMWWTFAITSAALFMVTLDNLVVTTALPVIRHDLHAGPRAASSGRSTPTRSPSRCCS